MKVNIMYDNLGCYVCHNTSFYLNFIFEQIVKLYKNLKQLKDPIFGIIISTQKLVFD